MADSKWHTLKPISDLRLLFDGFGALFLARGPWAAVILVLWSTLLATMLSRPGTAAAKIPSHRVLDCGLAFHNCGSH